LSGDVFLSRLVGDYCCHELLLGVDSQLIERDHVHATNRNYSMHSGDMYHLLFAY